MKNRLFRIPAILAAVGLALVLSGCPVSSDTRDTDMGGGGPLFGNPVGPVVLTIAGIPSGTTSLWIALHGQSGGDGLGRLWHEATVVGGTVTVTFQRAFAGEFTVSHSPSQPPSMGVLPPSSGTVTVNVMVGENPVIPFSAFN